MGVADRRVEPNRARADHSAVRREPTRALLIQRARRLRHNMTPEEHRLWWYLGGFEGEHFRRQDVIDRFIVDFSNRRRRMVIEVDGAQHALSRYDLRRDARLRQLGFTVLRFWNSDVMYRIDDVLEAIALELPPPPHLR